MIARSHAQRMIAASLLVLAVLCVDHTRADHGANNESPKVDSDAFTFVRIMYDSTGGFGESWYRHEGRNWQRWETDFPRAESNLMFRLDQLTSLNVNPDPIVLRLTDEALRDHPFIFMSDVGWQRLSVGEVKALESYLSAGGFLWVDDFWGDAEWDNFISNMRHLRKEWQWRRIPKEHPLMSIVYRVKECPQIPARIFYERTGQLFDPPQVHRYPAGGFKGVSEVHFMGLFDDEDRLLAIATHNTDVADGWEREGESKEYFDRFSIQSYAFSINVLVYAMTH